jgi:MFS family permease
MHFEEKPHKPFDRADGPWHQGLTRYHWLVLVVAALGWLFDTMDQQLFALARRPAMEELLLTQPAEGAPPLTLEQKNEQKKALGTKIGEYAGYSTTIFMVGWALGGLCFGILGDKIGRAKTMLLTILLYSLFTGLSAFSANFMQFSIYRFLTGLGVGGEFAVGVALVAETMPDRARATALGWVQALSAVGNMIGALISMGLGHLETSGTIGSSWRIMFLVGSLPALLAIVIRARLKEPERWQQARRSEGGEAKTVEKFGSLAELFGDPRWRKNTIVGMTLAFSGVVGLWGIGFFTFDLFREVFRPYFVSVGTPDAEISGKLTFWAGIMSLVQNSGAFFGVHAFSKITASRGRKPTFALFFVLATISTAFTWAFLGRILPGLGDIFWMPLIMGFCQIALFGGYAIYFPELFPTRLRSTGTSFCYNVGRLVAAVGPSVLGLLTSRVYIGFKETNPALPFRYAGITMCLVFLIGLAVLPFAPETKGQPLPE